MDHCTEIKKGDRVWLNNKAVPKGLSRKFHLPWAGPYVVLGRLGRVNYHIKPVSGNGKAKVVHRNRLKLDGRQSRMEETWPVDHKREGDLTAKRCPGEPTIHHEEKLIADTQPLQEGEPILLRRSNRHRRQPDRYQDYNLDELEIEDALS